MTRGFQTPERLMDVWAHAVTGNDPRRLEEVFADDAEFVNLYGSIWQGREAIIDGHAWALGGVLKDSTMRFESIETRSVGDDVVVMRGVCHRGRAANASAGTLPPGTTVLLLVAQRGGEGWTAISGANVAQQPPGV